MGLITLPMTPFFSHMPGLGLGSALGCPPGKALGGKGQREMGDLAVGAAGGWIVWEWGLSPQGPQLPLAPCPPRALAPAGGWALPGAAAPCRKLEGCRARGLDACHGWDGLCARAGLVARAGGCAKPGFGLGAVGEGAGRSPGRDKGAPGPVQPQPALPSARAR